MSGVLITGADGYLGSRLARKFLETTNLPLYLWVRARADDELQAKKEKLSDLLAHEGTPGAAISSSRVGVHGGALSDPEPFTTVKAEDIRTMVHTAAVTRFNVDEETARIVNLEGTKKALAFARRCPKLESFIFLSTVYASGLQTGTIPEVPFDGSHGFANHYERSKWLSEKEILEENRALPYKIFRVATVIADDNSGRVAQYNAFHNTLKLFYYGLLSLLPGNPDVPLYFVTGAFAADSIYEIIHSPSQETIFHVCHTREESLTLGKLINLAFEMFETREDFKSRRILRPLYTDEESFELLAKAAQDFSGGITNQALSSVSPFAKQLFIEKSFENKHLVSALKRYNPPDMPGLIERTCRYLAETRWGKEPARAAS